jgi:hypothetical protein
MMGSTDKARTSKQSDCLRWTVRAMNCMPIEQKSGSMMVPKPNMLFEYGQSHSARNKLSRRFIPAKQSTIELLATSLSVLPWKVVAVDPAWSLSSSRRLTQVQG